MHWEFLTLIPLLIAALLFATLRPWSARRGLQLVLLLLFAALAAVVLLGGGRPVGGRAVIVLDQSTNDPHTAAAAREAVARLAELGVVAYDLVLIDPEAETPAEEPPDERPWLRTHLDPVHIAPRKTISPEAAVGYACRRLAARRFRWLTAWCSADRVVVLATADARWRLMPPPAIAPLLQVAAEAGAVLDLVEPRIEDRAAKLTILTAGKLLPANTPLNDRPETLRLRLVSPQLADLEGEAITWRLEGEINKAEGAEPRFQLLDSSGRDTGIATIAPGGVVELELPLRCARPLGSQNRLPPGQHLAGCRLSIEHARLSAPVVGRTERYLRAGFARCLLVAGGGGRFPLAARQGTGSPAEAARQAWNHELPIIRPGSSELIGRWPWGVTYEVMAHADFAGRLAARDFAPDEWLCLVALDWKNEEWGEVWPALEPLVRQGLQLAVFGAPGEAAAALLPARGELSPYEVSGAVRIDPATGGPALGTGEPWLLDRTPRVFISFDESRIGNNPFQPKPLDPQAPVDQFPGLAHQRLVARGLLAELTGRAWTDAQLNGLTHDESSWVKVARTPPVSIPAGPEHDALDLWLPGSLDERLAALLPEGVLADLPRESNQFASSLVAGAPLGNEPAWRLPTHDVVIAFCYDTPQANVRPGVLAALLARGVRVYIVPIATPSGPMNADLFAEHPSLLRTLDSHLATEQADAVPFATRRGIPLTPTTDGLRAADQLWPAETSVLDIRRPAGPASQHVGKLIAGEVRRRLLFPESNSFIVDRLGRFIDERLGPNGEVDPQGVPEEEKWAGPRAMQIIRPVDTSQAAVLASVVEETAAAGGGLPVVVSGPLGRGSVSVYGYHPFEDLRPELQKRPAAGYQAEDPAQIRRTVFSADSETADRWGPQRILDLAALHADLRRGMSHGSPPLLAAAEVRDAAGRVRLTFLAPLAADRPLPSLELTADGRTTPVALVDVDMERGEMIGEVSPGSLRTLWPAEDNRAFLWADLRAEGSSRAVANHLFLRRPPEAAVDLPARQAIALATRHSGGVQVESFADLEARRADLRTPAAAGVVLALAGLYLLRAAAARHWRLRRAAPSKTRSREVDEEFSRPTLATHGDAAGAPVATPIGEFNRLRGWTAAEPLELVETEDFLRMFVLRQPVAPRVALRQADRAARIRLVVNLGPSMRLPRGPASRSKLACAKNFAAVLLNHLFLSGGSAVIEIIGLRGGPRRMEAETLEPAVAFLESQSEATPSWDAPLCEDWSDDDRVAYISDFLLEDVREFERLSGGFQAEGGLFGAVRIFTPREWYACGFGYAPGFGPLERSEWLPAEVKSRHAALDRRLGRLFVGSVGGFSLLSAESHASEFPAILAESDLLELVR